MDKVRMDSNDARILHVVHFFHQVLAAKFVQSFNEEYLTMQTADFFNHNKSPL